MIDDFWLIVELLVAVYRIVCWIECEDEDEKHNIAASCLLISISHWCNLLHIPNISISNLPSVTIFILINNPEISNLRSDFAISKATWAIRGFFVALRSHGPRHVEVAALRIHRNTAAGINGLVWFAGCLKNVCRNGWDPLCGKFHAGAMSFSRGRLRSWRSCWLLFREFLISWTSCDWPILINNGRIDLVRFGSRGVLLVQMGQKICKLFRKSTLDGHNSAESWVTLSRCPCISAGNVVMAMLS